MRHPAPEPRYRPINTAAGGALYHRKAQTPADQRRAKYQNLTSSRNVMHFKILGKCQPGQPRRRSPPKLPAAIITGIIASPSNPSVRLTALAEPTMTIMVKGTNSIPRFKSVSFEPRQRQLILQCIRMIGRCPNRSNACYDQAQKQPYFTGLRQRCFVWQSWHNHRQIRSTQKTASQTKPSRYRRCRAAPKAGSRSAMPPQSASRPIVGVPALA